MEIAADLSTVQCASGWTSPEAHLSSDLPIVLKQKADLPVHSIHGDPVILDDALGVLDPERLDAAEGP